jgi:hypothetical protein
MSGTSGPAMITFNPRPWPVAHSQSSDAGFDAETTATSWYINCFRKSDACITFKSLSLPMMMPTRGFIEEFRKGILGLGVVGRLNSWKVDKLES